jgi:hypothetical protein
MSDPTRSKRIQAIVSRRPGETLRSHEGFLAYLEDRNLANLARKGIATKATLYKWCAAADWQERASEYDAIELEAALEGRAAQRRLAQQILYDGAPEAARTVIRLSRGEKIEGEKASVTLQAAIHALAQAGLVPPKRTELTVQDGPNLSREADAMRKLDLETIRRLVRPPDVGAN